MNSLPPDLTHYNGANRVFTGPLEGRILVSHNTVKMKVTIKYQILTACFLLLGAFEKSHSLSAQAWNGASCAGVYYCNIGTIVPTSVIQTVPSSSFCAVAGGSGHSNTFNAGTSLFVRTQFAAVAGQKYCFSLRTFGSGTNNGSSIEIIDANCPAGSYVGTSYTAFGTQYSQMKNCLGWTAPNTQTYYIQLSGGTCGCNFFGCCGPTGFESESVDFKYATSASGAGSCSCSSGNLLPIELVRFKGMQNKEGIKIEWTTQTETNNDYFTLERSADAINFESVKIIKGAGTSYLAKDYSIIDYLANSGVNYYRLKQTDLNGESSQSAIISVKRLSDTKWLGDVYPSPAESAANFEVYGQGDDKALVELIDIGGRLVYSKEEMIAEGAQTLSIPVSEFAKGMYSLRVTLSSTGLQSATKLVKN